MKNYKTIVLGIFIISAIVINIIQPFNQNVAIACNPWDPDYNIFTGECDLPPSGEAPYQGNRCFVWFWDGYDYIIVWLDDYEINCEWAVVGSCSEYYCP